MGDFLEKIPQTPLKLLSHKQSLSLYKVLCGAFFQESDRISLKSQIRRSHPEPVR